MIILTEKEYIKIGCWGSKTIIRSSQIAIENEYDIRLLQDLQQSNILPVHKVERQVECVETPMHKIKDYLFGGY